MSRQTQITPPMGWYERVLWVVAAVLAVAAALAPAPRAHAAALASCHSYNRGVGTTSVGYPDGWFKWTCNSPAHQGRPEVRCQYATVADKSAGPTVTAVDKVSRALCGKTARITRAWACTRAASGDPWGCTLYYSAAPARATLAACTQQLKVTEILGGIHPNGSGLEWVCNPYRRWAQDRSECRSRYKVIYTRSKAVRAVGTWVYAYCTTAQPQLVAAAYRLGTGPATSITWGTWRTYWRR